MMTRQYQQNAQMHQMYVMNFHHHDEGPKRYLLERGIDENTICAYKLGATTTGRVAFPIFNLEGRVIGFQSRDITGKDQKSKYKNSENTEFFRKSDSLFGIDVAQKYAEELDCIHVVEGNIDVLTMYEYGLQNTVSIMGSNMSDNQAYLITKLSKNVVLVFDGDEAGVNGMMDAYIKLLKYTDKIHMVLLPKRHDPDSYLREHEHFHDIKVTFPLTTYLLWLKNMYDFRTVEGRFRFVREVCENLKHYPNKRDLLDAIRSAV